MSHEIKGTSQTKAQEPASALRYCTRCGAPFAAEDDDDGDLCGRCCLEPTSLTLLQMELNKLKKQRDTSQDMLLQATKQCDELKAKLAEKDEAQELLENERKLSAEFRRRLETVERMLKDSEACLADARAELERVKGQLDAMAAVVKSAYVHKDEVRKLVDALRMAELYVETEGSDEERSLLCKAFAHAKSLGL